MRRAFLASGFRVVASIGWMQVIHGLDGPSPPAAVRRPAALSAPESRCEQTHLPLGRPFHRPGHEHGPGRDRPGGRRLRHHPAAASGRPARPDGSRRERGPGPVRLRRRRPPGHSGADHGRRLGGAAGREGRHRLPRACRPGRVLRRNATAEPGTCGLTLGWQPDSLVPAAVAAARAADAAVVVNRVAGEAMDHERLELPGDQNRLISAVAAANPRTVVVLNTDGPVATPWLEDVEAVVQAWYGGRGMGTALAAVLFGDSDPAGRLPVTFPADAGQGPGTTTGTWPGTNGTVSDDEGIAVGCRYYDAKGQRPRFPFGHGLSCTTFAHGSVEAAYDRTAEHVTLGLTVTNTGRRRGTDVVQVYATLPAAAEAEPRRLVAFQKVTLPAAGSRRLTLTIPAQDLTVWRTGAWTLVPGSYTFATARSSRSLTAQRTLTIG
ncbi:glycoside hydrolase family 3 C-terminal domain-containing protein [Streptomyces sp. NPDC017936]|uniref:glycoside hydrolase family 3 C-terminal domain-containing protein n=1 Tax=Streptomyces sp. NPDC017936 TaxID=3365016 RepID=UPI00378AEBC3